MDEEVRPVARDLEHANTYPEKLIEQMKQLGIFGLAVPEPWGDAAVSMPCYALVTAELARDLADMATKLTAAKQLILDAAEVYDSGRRADMEAGMAKLFASETAMLEELAHRQEFADAPAMTLTAGQAATHQAIVGNRLSLVLDARHAAETAGPGPLAPPRLVRDRGRQRSRYFRILYRAGQTMLARGKIGSPLGSGDPVSSTTRPVADDARPDLVELVARTREFVATEVLPVEDRFDGDITLAGGDELRRHLQQAARDRGLLAPHAPVEHGGLGLSMTERARVFEAAGRSLFGALAINAAAPDEGNVHLLAHVATPAQQQEYLAPLVSGEVRSAFAMTEPAPGAGSDPSALTTSATRVPGGWRIDGRKIFITGAEGAGFFIIMARTRGEAGDRGGATMFLAPAGSPGLRVGRHVPTMDRSMVGGHCEVEFDGLVVPDDAVLGEVDEGFRYAQVRLGPARMTHVMRWLGCAVRAHEVAVEYAVARSGFGGTLADQGLVQQMIADNEIDLAATRALLDAACSALDAGSSASHETSIAKTFGAEAIGRVVDRSVQMCGGMGVSAELPVARIAREVRPFRIYDGPSEVHRLAIARRAVRAARTRTGS